MAHLRAR